MFSWGSKKKKFSSEPDHLHSDAITTEDGWLQGCGGLPSSVDSCAYEPIQRLLAVSTYDGRVKIFGGRGVETTLFSSCRYPTATRQLGFMVNKAVLVRLSETGFLECWSLGSMRSTKAKAGGHVSREESVTELCSIKLEHDTFNCFTALRQEPFLLLGCTSGALRFAALVTQQGGPVPELKPASNMRLLPYRVPVEELRAGGEVHSLSVRSIGPLYLVLMLHANTGVALWDLRAQQLKAQLNPRAKDADQPALRQASKITATCWLVPTSTTAADFCTGHEMGDVLVWGLPVLEDTAGRPQVQCRVRVVPGNASPVRSLHAATLNRKPVMLVQGGQADEPADYGMALVTLSQGDITEGEAEQGNSPQRSKPSGTSAASGTSVSKLPWEGPCLGFAMAPSVGGILGFEDVACIVQLLESLQFATYSISGGRAPKSAELVLAPGLQGLGDVTCTAACVIQTSKGGSAPAYALNMAALKQAASQMEGFRGDAASGGPHGWAGAMAQVVSGGVAPKPSSSQSTLYCTGCKTGYIYLWDLCGEQPQLVATAPSASAANAQGLSSGLRAVTALEIVPEHGILVSGHARGEVRVYQFADRGRQVEVTTLAAPNAKQPKPAKVAEEPGMQIRLRSSVHDAEIVAVHYAPASKLVVSGDKAGTVTVIDLTQPALLWSHAPVAQPCMCITLAQLPPHKKSGANKASDDEGDGHVETDAVVIVTSADSCVSALSVEHGELHGKQALQPKNRSLAICCELLDENFYPLWMEGGGKRARGKAGAGGGHWRNTLHGGGKMRKGQHSDDDTDDSTETDTEDDSDRVSDQEVSAHAAFMLLVSDQYIRIYSMSHVLSGDRSCDSRVSCPHPLIWASVFASAGGPGVVALAHPSDGGDPFFLVYSLPSMNLLCEQPLVYSLAPAVGEVPPGAAKARRAITATRDGRVLLLGECNELLQLAVSAALQPPALPHSLFDWELAQAAHAASTAHEQALLAALANNHATKRRRSVGDVPKQDGAGPEGATDEESDVEMVDTELEPEAKQQQQQGRLGTLDLGKHLGGVFKQVTQGVTKVYEGTSRGLVHVASKLETGVKGVGKLFLEEGPDALTTYNAQHPDLAVILGQAMADEKQSRRKKKNAAADEDDGIPVTTPQPLVLASTTTAAATQRAAAASRIKGAESPVSPSRRGAAASKGAQANDVAESSGDSTDNDKEQLSKPARQSSLQAKSAKPAGKLDRASSSGDIAATGSSAGAKGLDSRQDKSDKGRQGKSEKSDGGKRRTADDEDGQEQEGPAARHGNGGNAMAGAKQLAQDMRAQLLGGAQALVGGIKGFTSAAIQDDESDPKATPSTRAAAGTSSGRYQPAKPATDRSVSEIKKFYGAKSGRDFGGAAGTTNKAKQITEVVHETKQKLHERGERLKKLDESAAGMQNEAAGFADLARQLVEKERNRKWWQV